LRPKRVLLLSASDTKGGAARVASYLGAGLIDAGMDVTMLVSRKHGDADFVHALDMPERRRGVGDKLLHRLGWNSLGLGNPSLRRVLSAEELRRYDIIHLHDLPLGFNFMDLWRVFGRCKLVWTIHSMAPLTGNCVYSYDCTRWMASCGHCPQYGQWPLHWLHRDGSREVLTIKNLIYRAMNLHVVGVSEWITEAVSKSVLHRAQKSTVHNPSWSEDFFPIERAPARARLGVPEDAFAIMFAHSGATQDLRKGADIIRAAAEELRDDGIFLLPTGITGFEGGQNQAHYDAPGRPPQHLSTAKALRGYYTAADVLWHPSRADTSSMMSLEAFGCGTPVIAASVGGVPEIVQHERSGLLVPPNDPHALASATRRLMSDRSLLKRLRGGALERAKVFSPSRFVREYCGVYEGVLRSRRPESASAEMGLTL